MKSDTRVIGVVLVSLILVSSVTSVPRHFRYRRQISHKELLLRQICAIGNYTFRHPFSCGSYLICDKGQYTEQDCPTNMVYDVKIKACNFRRKVKCIIVDGMSEFGDNPFDDAPKPAGF